MNKSYFRSWEEAGKLLGYAQEVGRNSSTALRDVHCTPLLWDKMQIVAAMGILLICFIFLISFGTSLDWQW